MTIRDEIGDRQFQGLGFGVAVDAFCTLVPGQKMPFEVQDGDGVVGIPHDRGQTPRLILCPLSLRLVVEGDDQA